MEESISKQIIEGYLTALQNGDVTAVLNHFTSDGVVDSPVYGSDRPAVDFYKELFSETSNSRIETKFVSAEADMGVAIFEYHWTLEGGKSHKFTCADFFEFEDGRIKRLKIIYDTFPARKTFGDDLIGGSTSK